MGVGIDLVDVSLVRRLVEVGGREFLDSAWTRAEQVDTNGDPERLAGRWAAKEAAMKAMRTGIGDLEPVDFELLNARDGSSSMTLSEAAASVAGALGIRRWLVSISHEGGWATALVLAVSTLSGTPPEAGR